MGGEIGNAEKVGAALNRPLQLRHNLARSVTFAWDDHTTNVVAGNKGAARAALAPGAADVCGVKVTVKDAAEFTAEDGFFIRSSNYAVATNSGTLTFEGVTLEFNLSGGTPQLCWPSNAATSTRHWPASVWSHSLPTIPRRTNSTSWAGSDAVYRRRQLLSINHPRGGECPLGVSPPSA